MTQKEILNEQREAFRMFLKKFDREALLAFRQDIDERIGYRETVGYFLLQGIAIEGKKFV